MNIYVYDMRIKPLPHMPMLKNPSKSLRSAVSTWVFFYPFSFILLSSSKQAIAGTKIVVKVVFRWLNVGPFTGQASTLPLLCVTIFRAWWLLPSWNQSSGAYQKETLISPGLFTVLFAHKRPSQDWAYLTFSCRNWGESHHTPPEITTTYFLLPQLEEAFGKCYRIYIVDRRFTKKGTSSMQLVRHYHLGWSRTFQWCSCLESTTFPKVSPINSLVHLAELEWNNFFVYGWCSIWNLQIVIHNSSEKKPCQQSLSNDSNPGWFWPNYNDSFP